MISIDKSSYFWQYLSDGQKGLIEEGLYLLKDTKQHPDANITDYSYLVFPFGKAYEGFLKHVFLDLGFIKYQEYESDHFRIGKALNPHMRKFIGKHSLYLKLIRFCSNSQLADELWEVWKIGRNQVFHYFPHNIKALTLDESQQIIQRIIDAMQLTVRVCKMKTVTSQI